MRGKGRWIAVVVVAIVAVIGVIALLGGGDDSDETVSAAQWADDICGAGVAWREEMDAISKEQHAETSQGNADQARATLERGVTATDTVVTEIENVGVPDTPHGEDAKQQVDGWANLTLDSLAKAQDTLAESAGDSEQAAAQMTEATAAIDAARTTGAQAIKDAASLDPELEAAVSASSACQQLQSS